MFNTPEETSLEVRTSPEGITWRTYHSGHDNTPNQVRSRISKKKRLKNKSTITVDEETNRNSTKPIANQWYQLRQDNNINHYISQPPVERVQSSYSNIVSRKKKKLSNSELVF